MDKQIKIDDLDKKIIYYYRNNFPIKDIMNKTGESKNKIIYRIHKLKKQNVLKRWWEE